MKRLHVFLATLFISTFCLQTTAWFFSRRRRSCSASNCRMSSWSSWSSCSKLCGGGAKSRSRYKVVSESCGGSCPYSTRETSRCNSQCCSINCSFLWGNWSPCTGCGNNTRSRSPIIYRSPSCGGTACPGKQTQSCNTGVCCPVNCVVNAWGSWGRCTAACEQTGRQTRTRSVRTPNKCGGTGCPTLSESRPCRGGCCRRDCTVSSWSAWSSCNAPSGQCGANSGTKSRSRKITRQPSCGGSACPTLSNKLRCTPVPITCVVSSWSSYGPCKANNGRCGAGTQTRTRTIKRNPYCSRACPTLTEKRSCTHSCCPVNCVVSSWSAWTACTATCGSGIKVRTRRITTQPSCRGQACPALKMTTSCTQYNNKDCVLSGWSSWSQCSNGCGQGTITKTRRVVSQAVCQGKRCGPLSARKICTSYRENRNCVVGVWGSWGACNAKCAVGSRQRSRPVTIRQRCRGTPCPSLTQTSSCGSANGGCQHVCSNGVCSCRPGYNLASNKRTCTAKNCGKAQPSFCAQGTRLGSTCQYALVTCPGGKTTYPVTCSLGCLKYYSIKGTNTITCQTTGVWTSFRSTYCRRNNDPPTQIILSGTSSVKENMPRGTKVGTFSSLDPVNSKDRHTYRLTRGGNGLFELRGANLLTMRAFNFEASPNAFGITVRSTDNGIPSMYLDKSFTIRITDVNEDPTDIQLSSSSVNENSDVETTVGMLSTADPDQRQSFTYQLLNNAGGRFKVVNNFVKVAQSNRLCLQVGGSHCSLNYEQQSYHQIQIRSTDSGSPSKSIIKTLNVTINDVNDKPRDIRLSNQKVKENAAINTVIGQLTARDEDSGQLLVFSLDNDDNGRFKIDSKGRLLKAKATDYETSKVHLVTVRVTDNGSPRYWVSKQCAIIVLNVNEPPLSVTLDNTNVRENSSQGTRIGKITAHDNDALQNLTFSLDDSAGGKFSLDTKTSCKHFKQGGSQCSTVLMVSGILDYEDAQWETITIRVTDNKGLFYSKTLNITVIDVNDKPTNVTLEGSLMASINENSRDLEIGELQTVDQDVRQSFNYTLLSNGGGNFEIRGNKLFVSRSANLDYEKVKTYRVGVRSTDSGKPPYSTEATITININDLNEKPTDITLSKNTVLENTPTGTVIGSLSINDPDNLGPIGVRQTHTCRIKDSANGMIGVAVNRNVNQLTVGPAGVNYEANGTVSISVQCSDPKGLTVEKVFKVIVQDVNEAPTNIMISNLKVSENQIAPTTVGKVTVVDPDNEITTRQTFKVSILSSSPVPFAVQNGNLIATKTLDFEADAQWSFRIRVQDNGTPPKTRVEAFTVQVLDANDKPTSVSLSNSAVNENSDQGTLVGTLNTVDQDVGQNYTYIMMNSSNGRFMIDNNAVKVAQSNKKCLSQGGSYCLLNYEETRQQRIRVRSTDDGVPPLYFDTDFVIYIRDVNDQPRGLKLSSNRIKENATINTLIGQFSASDEDVKQSQSFSLANDDGGRFRVGSSGALYKAKTTNYETQKKHTIRAVVTDNGRPAMKMEKQFTIEVLDVNEAPVKIQITSNGAQMSFPVNSARVKENSLLRTVVGTLEALDYDSNQQLTFKLDDDANGKFILDSPAKCSSVTNLPGFNTNCTTFLRLMGSLNYEEKRDYTITVRSIDNHGLFTTQQLSIAVVDQNDAPTNISLGGGGSANINENSNGALVGAMATTDEDVSQTFVYTLLRDAAGRFVIRGNKLFVSNSANLDFEKQSSYSVTVRVQDSGIPSLDFSKDFFINVLDRNEAPTMIGLDNSHVRENSKPGTVIGSLNVTDPDNLGPQGVRQSHVCTVVGSQIGKFVVQNNVLSLSRAIVDFEQASTQDVFVKCVDNGSPVLYRQQKVVVVVDDVNEAPSQITLASSSIQENLSPSLVGTLSTTDPDNEGSIRQLFTYRFVGDTAGLPFAIDGSALNTTRSLDYETQSTWNLTIQSTDNGNPPKSVINSFTIYVIDVNEQPKNIALSWSVVNENSGIDTMIGTLSCQDPDANQTHTYVLTDTASGRFKLVQNKLMVALNNDDCLNYGGSFCKLNFEAQRQHVIRVRSTDNGVPPQSNERSFTITLRDVNDRPRDLRISGYSVKENATIGTRIGKLSAIDEDKYQTVSFSLVSDDNGRFTIDPASGYLVKAKSTDYETSKVHMVTVQVRDNGTKPLSLNKTFRISVENINEPPLNISISSQGGQHSFPDNMPQVNENSPSGTIVGTIISLDHDEVELLSFKLLDDAAGKFSINSSVTCKNESSIPGMKSMCSASLLVTGLLNYEQSRTEDIVVRVTDPQGLFLSKKFTIKVLNVNDRPSNITLSGSDTGYVDENANNALVGDLAAVDEDAYQTHTFRLVGNGGWKFVLKGTKVYTARYANIDYEKQSTFTIVVRAMDNGRPRLFIDKSFVIQIRDVNEKSTDIILTNKNISENSPHGLLVGKVSVVDPDDKGPRGPWQVHGCIIFNSVPFIVNQTTSELLVAGDLNYELKQTIDVILRCHDNGTPPLYIEKTVKINILDVNEAPTSIRLSGYTVAENSGIVAIGTLDTVDPDNLLTVVQTFSYSIVNGSGLPFTIDGNTLNTTRSLDYETKPSWEISIQSKDNKGMSVTRKFIVMVTNRNDAPTSIIASGLLSIVENSAPGTYIGTISTADQDVGQTHTYRIESVLAEGHNNTRNDSSLLKVFSIGTTSGTITLSSQLNYEQYTNYTLLIRAIDNGSPPLSVTGYINIGVKDINEVPLRISLGNKKVFENSPVDLVVGSLYVQDPDNAVVPWQKFTCHVTNPLQAPFKVISHLSLAVSRDVLDFETQKIYSVSVNCSELTSSPLSIATTFTINVLDVNEAPYNLTISNTSIPENGSPGDTVGILNVLDPDTSDSGYADIFLSIQDQSNLGTFKISNRSLISTRTLDFEAVNLYQVTVIAMDSGTPPLNTTITFEVKVLDKNDPPSAIYLDSNGIFENATAGVKLGTLSTVDQDKNQTHTYTVVNPTGLFNVSGNTLVLNKAMLDYESAPLINVTLDVTDNGYPPQSVKLVVSVTVLDSNDPPTDIIVTSSLPLDVKKRIMVPENSPGGTPLANLSVVDQDISQSHTCVMLDGQTYFIVRTVTKSTAQVLVNDVAGLDYETMANQVITVTVQCTDSGNPPYSKNLSFYVTVSDVNEAPYNITLSLKHDVQEHVPKGFVIGDLSCQDPDFDQIHVFTVIGNSSKIFEVNQTLEALVVKKSSYLDYEAFPNGTIPVTILATDNGIEPLSKTKVFIIRVTDVNDAPYFGGLINVTVKEDIARGRCIAQIKAKDPDHGQTPTLSLLTHDDKFVITNTCFNVSSNKNMTGGSYLTSKGSLSYDNSLPGHFYDVLVQAKDNGDPPLAFNTSAFVYVQLVDPCISYNDCNGNASCYRVNKTDYNCRCNPGFTGDGRSNCSNINECLSNPCYPYGTCIDGLNAYHCNCTEGFIGNTRCTPIDYCAPNPCLNNGTCINLNGTISCYCIQGYTGSNCSVDIDECAQNPCNNHGNCTDGINRFDCACFEGFMGTQCQRSTEDCEPHQCDDSHVCVPRNQAIHVEDTEVCINSDFVIPLYLNPSAFPLELVSTSHWQYQLQNFVKSYLPFPLGQLNNDEEDNSLVYATDLFVVKNAIISLKPHSEKHRRKRSTSDDNIKYTAVYFVVKYKSLPVSQETFYVSLNKTCVRINSEDISSFGKKICGPAIETMTRLNIKPYMPRTSQQEKGLGPFMHPYMYYAFAGIGALILLLLIIGVALHRRNTLEKRKLRAFQIHDNLLDTNGFHADVMQRHQLSNEGEGIGATNPMYGTQEDVEPSLAVLDNPLYTRPDGIDDSILPEVGFSNPMYQSFKSKRKNEAEDEEDEEEELELGENKTPLSDSSAQPLFQTTTRKLDPEEISTETVYQKPNKKQDKKKNKKTKKQAGKKQKNISEDNDGIIPDIAAANPMFLSRDAYKESQEESKDGKDLYAFPKKKISKTEPGEETSPLWEDPTSPEEESTGFPNYGRSDLVTASKPVYDTPRKAVNNTEGMSNPMFQSSDYLEGPDETPGDIVSAFAEFSIPSKTVGEDPGQSEC